MYISAINSPAPVTPPLVHAEGLGRSYGPVWALQQVHVSLGAGASLLLAGRNGAGKTTLLRILATTLQPSTGTLRIGGIDPTADPQAVRRRIALLSHRTQLYEELSNRQMLTVTADLLGRDVDVDALLARVGLDHAAHRRVRDDSAGMRKRLAFARMLLQDPDLILLDEPYGQLDPAGFAFVDELLVDLMARGKTLVVATHLIPRAAAILKYGLVLDGGKPAWVGDAIDTPAALDRVLAA